MTLSDKQFEFAKDVTKLLIYLINNGYKFTLGEALRTKEQQRIYFDSGASLTMNSQHLDKMAIDLNIWVDGDLTYNKDKLFRVGRYWKSLSPENRWGGDFKDISDANHFERK